MTTMTTTTTTIMMMTTSTNLSKEDEMFLDGEVIEEDIVLRTETEACAHLINVAPDVKSAHDSRSAGRRKKTCITTASFPTLARKMVVIVCAHPHHTGCRVRHIV